MRTPHRTTIALVSGASVIAALAACTNAAASTGSVAGHPSAAADPVAATNDSGYTDGTYSATGSYQTPNDKQSIDVALTLQDGVITAVDVTPEAKNPTSAQYQHSFASAIADVVVGKPIDDAHIDVVSGSSATSEGFNAALAKIASDARA